MCESHLIALWSRLKMTSVQSNRKIRVFWCECSSGINSNKAHQHRRTSEAAAFLCSNHNQSQKESNEASIFVVCCLLRSTSDLSLRSLTPARLLSIFLFQGFVRYTALSLLSVNYYGLGLGQSPLFSINLPITIFTIVFRALPTYSQTTDS